MATLLRFDDTADTDHPLYARYAEAAAGVAGPCPECDGAGVVSSVEGATSAQSQCCSSCGYRWQYRFDATGRITELRELSGRRLDLLAPSPQEVAQILDLRDPEPAEALPRPGGRPWWRRSPIS